ncbi:hypothetical protein HispidOSU_028168, partial [Sigmodon hispidus]
RQKSDTGSISQKVERTSRLKRSGAAANIEAPLESREALRAAMNLLCQSLSCSQDSG